MKILKQKNHKTVEELAPIGSYLAYVEDTEDEEEPYWRKIVGYRKCAKDSYSDHNDRLIEPDLCEDCTTDFMEVECEDGSIWCISESELEFFLFKERRRR